MGYHETVVALPLIPALVSLCLLVQPFGLLSSHGAVLRGVHGSYSFHHQK